MRYWATVLVACAAMVVSGCGLVAEAPPKEEPKLTPIQPKVSVSQAVPQAVRFKIPVLAGESTERRARRMTVRVRNVSCQGVAVGSGVAVSRRLLVTNRHVLAGAAVVEVATWDGRSVDVAGAEVGVLGDIGLVRVDDPLPEVVRYGAKPSAGDVVTVVGYPLGGRLTLRGGTVVDFVDGGKLGIPGSVMRLTATVQPGNSGGPVLNRGGRLIGVIYAIETATGYALAIPVETLERLERVGGYEEVPPCGSE